MDSHGVVRYRYEHAVLLQVENSDLDKLYEHNKAFCDRDNLLAPASKTMRYGALTKNHLIHGLKCFRSGAVRWDDTKEVI